MNVQLEACFSIQVYTIRCIRHELCVHTPPTPNERSLEIPRGKGLFKAKLLKENYESKLEFPGGEGVQNRTPSMVEYG